MDTIFALATARGKAGVAVIRISGPHACAALSAFGASVPQPRMAALRNLRSGDDVLDSALVLYFPAGQSFTGDEVVELHCHGSLATTQALLRALSDVDGLRLAEPGEFTRRALENGKLDLAQIEGLADLVEAETEAQRKQAHRVLSGAIGTRAEGWRSKLIRAAALLEAVIDFADEEVPTDVSPEVLSLIEACQDEMAGELAGVAVAERIREGFEVAIIGPPNAGKSTLLNRLAGREAAITSRHAGTTRDVIEVRMDLAGLPVTLLDTAGLRETVDEVEQAGVDLARRRASAADLRVVLLDGDTVPDVETMPGDITLRGKADTDPAGQISGVTGQGVDALIAQITQVLETRASGAGTLIRERHRVAMARALDALDMAHRRVQAGEEQSELAAEELRTTIRALDSLVGRVDVEDLLDEIFASFCLGK
ncbi:tRNA modification GTPase TrmE [Actibacterium mucosum KCTC 23349]|uniref:tRNA modification GTPase MnmE n=1 Tax=Actibacterium mucosum KCTC 23349 TaxID=1454373 RepID=A0A037ZMB9_9RHOB|nr:tRNA uridine-5-carboxymethylaminomethyl(34) synthesis GTPase MnmE [Actibacterium mucosum]KAJ57249.1 tRNA modification GTPase TrmE [Actibacterium mucosum KCTC 23349]